MTSVNLKYHLKGPISKGSLIGGQGFIMWIWGVEAHSVYSSKREKKNPHLGDAGGRESGSEAPVRAVILSVIHVTLRALLLRLHI